MFGSRPSKAAFHQPMPTPTVPSGRWAASHLPTLFHCGGLFVSLQGAAGFALRAFVPLQTLGTHPSGRRVLIGPASLVVAPSGEFLASRTGVGVRGRLV